MWAKSQDSVHKPQFFKRKESRSGSNHGPSAYQPGALPPGHTGSPLELSKALSVKPEVVQALLWVCILRLLSGMLSFSCRGFLGSLNFISSFETLFKHSDLRVSSAVDQNFTYEISVVFRPGMTSAVRFSTAREISVKQLINCYSSLKTVCSSNNN